MKIKGFNNFLKRKEHSSVFLFQIRFFQLKEDIGSDSFFGTHTYSGFVPIKNDSGFGCCFSETH